MHGRGPYHPHVDLSFGEEPQGFFGTLDSAGFAVEHQVHAIDPELLGETGDLFALRLCHSVRHDAEGGDAEIVEADHVVEALHDDEAVVRDEFTVTGFLQAAGLLAEEFDASMKAFREPMFGGWFFSGAFCSGELLEFHLFLFELHIASGPRQDFALLGEDRVEELPRRDGGNNWRRWGSSRQHR